MAPSDWLVCFPRRRLADRERAEDWRDLEAKDFSRSGIELNEDKIAGTLFDPISGIEFGNESEAEVETAEEHSLRPDFLRGDILGGEEVRV